MQGDDRVRYCAVCKLNVYDFQKMSTTEIEQIIGRGTQRVCARIRPTPQC
jgi:hypothetical protein